MEIGDGPVLSDLKGADANWSPPPTGTEPSGGSVSALTRAMKPPRWAAWWGGAGLLQTLLWRLKEL